jgi:transketolase N-terminal domain/subunit
MTAEEMTPLAMSTIRTLSIDAVEQAKSGHPGTLVALAPLIYTIWNRVMRFDPEDGSGLTAIVSSCRMTTLPCRLGQDSISPEQRR